MARRRNRAATRPRLRSCAITRRTSRTLLTSIVSISRARSRRPAETWGGDAPTRLTRKAAAEEAGFARGLTVYKQIVYISGE
jgi:hypothetical protein